jgi:integrase
MAHFPKPFFKKARGLWYVEINRKQINLGPDRDEAFRQYHQLMLHPREQPVSADSLAGVVDAYLEWVHKHRAADTYEWYRYRLQRLVSKYPEMRVNALRPYHIEQWVDDYELAVTSQRNYYRSIKTCLRWAVRQGHLDKNPIAALEVPGADRREVYVPPEEFEKLLESVTNDAFRDLLVTTYQTGCRPQESLKVTADFVDLKNGRWVFPQNESKGKKSPRVIYLTEDALGIARRLALKYPNGPLFRNSRDKPWTTEAVNCFFDRIQTKMGRELAKASGDLVTDEEIEALMPTLCPTRTEKGVRREKSQRELRSEAKRKLSDRKARRLAPRYSLYALRHSWATNALRRGVDSLTVAILMGHKDPSMLARVYQHLSHNPEHMREQARRAAG